MYWYRVCFHDYPTLLFRRIPPLCRRACWAGPARSCSACWSGQPATSCSNNRPPRTGPYKWHSISNLPKRSCSPGSSRYISASPNLTCTYGTYRLPVSIGGRNRVLRDCSSSCSCSVVLHGLMDLWTEHQVLVILLSSGISHVIYRA